MWRWLTTLALVWPLGAAAQDFFTLKGHGGPIKGIAAFDDAILTASFDNSVGFWVDGTPQWLEGHDAAVNVVLFKNRAKAYSAGDDFTVFSWDLQSGAGTKLGQHKGKVIGMASHADTVATASWDGTIGLWRSAPQFLKGHNSAVNAVVFSDDGSHLYSAAADGTIRIWDVEGGSETRRLVNQGFGINTLALNEDMGWIAYGAVDGVTRLVDLQTGDTLADFTHERRPILGMALSPDGRLLATGDGQGYISLIDTETKRYVADFRATLRGPVWALAFSPDGQNLHAGGLDEAMYSWPVETLGDGEQMVQGEKPFLQGAEAASNGERQFNRKCSICHSLTADGGRKAGPTLYNLFGRGAGALDDYAYSKTLLTSDIVWTDQTIDALFDLGPDIYIHGSKMPMQRITKPQDRADLIEYLKGFTRGEN
ncbi:MAG: c-type cytochrome [Pseudomonadota bacterium]